MDRAPSVQRPHGSRRGGFSLIELVTVVGIIAVLTGILLPSVQGVRAEARSVSCLSNLKQNFSAIESYRQQNGNSLPNCDPLPAATPEGPIGGLNDALSGYIDRTCECWLCAADYSGDSEELGTSYFYTPGLLILTPLVQFQMPPDIFEQPQQARLELEARLVTAYFDGEGKDATPILFDNDDYHVIGTRVPRNGLFIDGTVRVLTKTAPSQSLSDS